jgi:hypothetical protein
VIRPFARSNMTKTPVLYVANSDVENVLLSPSKPENRAKGANLLTTNWNCGLLGAMYCRGSLRAIIGSSGVPNVVHKRLPTKRSVVGSPS